MTIKTLSDLLGYFPPAVKTGAEIHSACPYCSPGSGKLRFHRGRAFYGEDRLIWFPDAVWCRRCHTYKRIDEMAEEIEPGSELVIDEVPEVVSEKIETPVGVTDNFINAMHSKVDRDYWYAFGWTDEVIDKFRLGYGPVGPGSRRGQRHLIPFKAQSFDWDGEVWIMEGRTTDPAVAEKYGKNIKTPGVSGKVFCHIVEGKPSTVAVCEGMKDAVTLYLLGHRHILMLPGTSIWDKSMGSYLQEYGYDRIEVFSDNDEAGRKLAQSIGTYFRNELVTVMSFFWPSEVREGYDITDYLVDNGLEETKRQAKLNLKTAPLRGFIQDYTTIDPDYIPESHHRAKSVQDIREELPSVIDDYLNNYRELKKSYKRPVLQVLAAPPGTGKSYEMVRAAQEVARRHLDERIKERKVFEDMLSDESDPDRKVALEKELARLPLGQIVLYAGPFRAGWDDIINQPIFDEDLWYFFDSRNEDNCEDFGTASVLGNKGYNVLSYCMGGCPFAARCKSQGYLKQYEEIKNKPIAYVRHQHLLDQTLLGRYKVLMVDENPLKVIEQGQRVYARDLMPASETWREYLLPNEAEAVENLVDMLRRILNDSMSEYVSYTGAEFFRRLESVGDLDNVIKNLSSNAADHFQPRMPILSVGSSIGDLPARKIPDLIDVILREYPIYKEGDEFNSRLSLVNRTIEFYGIEKVPISQYKPVVVSDGTPMIDLYGAAFRREVLTYDPSVYSDLAETVVLTGKDYTMRAFLQSTKYLRNQEEYEELPEDDPDSDPDEVDFRSKEVQDIYNLIKFLEDRHERVLFISTKERKRLIEEQLLRNYPDLQVDFNHYGNVRGSNAYKDHDAIIVWGAYREPYTTVYRRISAWAAYMEIDHFIPYRITNKPKPYHSRWEGHSYITFEDDFADRFVDLVEAGEIRQAMDRIRPHTSAERKMVYVVMSRPVASWITHLMFSNEVLRQVGVETDTEILEGIAEYYWERGRLPTYEDLSKTYKKSNRDVTAYRSTWEEGQKEELDENATKALTYIHEHNSMSIAYSELIDKFDIDWQSCKALRRRLDDDTSAERLSAG